MAKLCSMVLYVVIASGAGAEEALEYFSDYYSFVGEDAQGHAAFALDNNRGRDGGDYQAEHFGVLHVEHLGWQPLEHTGSYPNPKGVLETIPDSTGYEFRGSAERGVVIDSPANRLRLTTDPLELRFRRESGGSRFEMTSAAATLAWQDRLFTGRVIHEGLYLRGSNRLARFEYGILKGFHGFYLRLGEGDWYLHHLAPSKVSGLLGQTDGFQFSAGEVSRLREAKVAVSDNRWALGFFRWPTRWKVAWTHGGEQGTATLVLTEQNIVANWGLGGFAMGIIRGTARIGEREVLYYGLAELIQ